MLETWFEWILMFVIIPLTTAAFIISDTWRKWFKWWRIFRKGNRRTLLKNLEKPMKIVRRSFLRKLTSANRLAIFRSTRLQVFYKDVPANIYLFKLKNRNTKKRSKICLKLTIKHENDVRPSGLCNFNFEHVSLLFLVYLLLLLNK